VRKAADDDGKLARAVWTARTRSTPVEIDVAAFRP
jgi:hypothetical protein